MCVKVDSATVKTGEKTNESENKRFYFTCELHGFISSRNINKSQLSI